MSQRQFRTLLGNGLIWAGAAAFAAYSAVTGYRPENWPLLAVGAAVLLLGELLEVDLPGGRSTPVSSAVIFALFVVLEPQGVVAAMLPAFGLAVLLKSRRLGPGAPFRSSSRRLTSTLFALSIYFVFSQGVQPMLVDGPVPAEMLSRTLVMVIVGILQLLVDTGASAILIGRAQKIPGKPIWRSQLGNGLALHLSFLSVAALMALTYSVLKEFSFVLFLLPLIAARKSFRRYASIHKTYVQTVRALSRVPEMAGYSPKGHSLEVARLATSIARDQGMSDNEVRDVEFAALMHDIGLISYDDPMDLENRPTGSSIAVASASLLSKTPYLERVARIVKNSEEPFPRIAHDDSLSISSRIVKVAKDYVEFADGETPSAISEINARSGAIYDPRIVIALERVLAHHGSL